VQVGVQIGLDDIEKITREKNKLSKGKARARHPWWWVLGWVLVCAVSSRSWAGARETGLHSPEVAPQEAV
jgi:hypothetical protein